MYQRDVPIIADYARTSPQGLADLITFVLVTIQQPLSSCTRQLDDIRQHGADSRYLFGSKRDGYKHIQQYKGVYWQHFKDWITKPEEAIDLFTHIPGIGIAKAGFISQCLGLETACLDTHNLKRLGYPDNFAFKFTPKDKRKIIHEYVSLCNIKGSEYWWDTWCEGVAGSRFNKVFKNADLVSAYHKECVVR